jgi:AcrR family transcriptional regulator
MKLESTGLHSPRESRRADREARRRADALAAAAAVFSAKGYHDAQMTEIAAAAELSRASLYSLFAGKQELYEAVISEAATAIGDAVRGDVAALDDPGERLLCVIDSLFACYEANQALLRIYAASTHGLPFKIRDAMGEATLQRFVQFTTWVGELSQQAKSAGLLAGLDSEAIGVSLVGTVTTTAVRWIESTPERPLSQAAPAVRAMFQRLLGERETA